MPSSIRTIAITNRGLTSGPRSGSTNVCLALSLAPGTPPRLPRRMAALHTSGDTLVGVSDRPHRRLRGLRARASGSGPAGESVQRPRRSLVWRVATPLIGLLSGALFVISAHSSDGTDLRPGRFVDLASLVQYDATRVDSLKSQVSDL